MLNLTWAAAVAVTASAMVPPAQAPTPPPAPDDERPLTRIVQNLGRDLRDFPSIDTVIVLGAGGAAATIAGRSDHRVNRWTLDHAAPSFTAIGRVGGDGWTQGGIALGTWALGQATGHRLTAHVGSDLIRAQMLNAVTTLGLKIVVDRQRPSGGSHAFPSGHTSAAFASAGVVHGHFGWKAGVPAYAAASFVGWTRVRDRMHWVSDVVFGAALGLAAARTVTAGHRTRSWTVTPVVTTDGVGLWVTRAGRPQSRTRSSGAR